MDLNDYQQQAMKTCLPTCNNIVYMGFNLAAETGELLGKLAKAVRHDQLHVSTQDHDQKLMHPLTQTFNISDEQREAIRKEAGDVLWQIAGVCTVMGWKLADVAQENIEKLASRQLRGTIDGSGDNR